MARFSVDHEGVTSARLVLAADPRTLRTSADALATAVSAGQRAVGVEAEDLARALSRFGLVHAWAVDALASASAALAGELEVAAADARDTELAVATALGGLSIPRVS
ncbi:hypothetical protein N865_15450 [Intrasporangium oryzae NRRL B-24470]|uniref:Uncharacterized protein n=1 Tax=Intrasporangium oryzae NRRL B-24470 TaxID=1386089 RepID=W9G2Y1_9MICO|nr:hypothetical protein [Intrasporangium oryzae]EWT00476.1 hypothetical protein N865_15450 [Intrasporangium oryzae NRRL B-24470]